MCADFIFTWLVFFTQRPNSRVYFSLYPQMESLLAGYPTIWEPGTDYSRQHKPIQNLWEYPLP